MIAINHHKHPYHQISIYMVHIMSGFVLNLLKWYLSSQRLIILPCESYYCIAPEI